MNTIARIATVAVAIGAAFALGKVSAAPPAFVDITWMSISNMYYELGPLHIVTDGYITRLPQDAFFGGGGYAQTRRPFRPDAAAVTRVMNALGRPTRVNLLLTGHSHWDHSFDTATWSKLTGARIIGSKTTCLQAQAEGVPAERCRVVNGRETLALGDGVTMRVVRWNHSGDPAVNPEQHNPVELHAVPVPDPATGGLRAGVAEDFPNGGGNRAYLFTVDGPDGRFSWFFSNSASAVDLHVPIVIDGVDYGAPIENLKSAMKDAKLDVGRFVDRRECGSCREARGASADAEGLHPRSLGWTVWRIRGRRAETVRGWRRRGISSNVGRGSREAGAVHGQMAARSQRRTASSKH